MTHEEPSNEVIVPVVVEVDGETFRGQARNLNGSTLLCITMCSNDTSRLVFTDDKEPIEAEVLAKLIAGKSVETVLTNIHYLQEFQLPKAVIRPLLTGDGRNRNYPDTHAQPQLECSFHPGGCAHCPDCRLHSYCRVCVGCKRCGYPNIVVPALAGLRFIIEKAAPFYLIRDLSTDLAPSPRTLFAYGSLEYRRSEYTPHERLRALTELGGDDNCVKLLTHYFFVLGRPCDDAKWRIKIARQDSEMRARQST